VDAVNAFQTEHGLVIRTVDGAEYKIKVTDANPEFKFDCIDWEGARDEDNPMHMSYTYNLFYHRGNFGASIWICQYDSIQQKYKYITDETIANNILSDIKISSSNQEVIPDEKIEFTKIETYTLNGIKQCVFVYSFDPVSAGDAKITFSSNSGDLSGEVSADIHVINEEFTLATPSNFTVSASTDGTKLHFEWDNNSDSQCCDSIWIWCQSDDDNNKYGFGNLISKNDFNVSGNKATYESLYFLGTSGKDEILNVHALFADECIWNNLEINLSYFATDTYENTQEKIGGTDSLTIDRYGEVRFPSVPNAIGYRLTFFKRDSGSQGYEGDFDYLCLFRIA